MPRRSRPSGRPSTTSPRTSKARTPRELIDGLPPERAAAVFTHSSWAADRTDVLRAARVPRRLGARARDRAHAVRPLPGLQRGADGEGPLARRLAGELRGRRARARPRRAAARERAGAPRRRGRPPRAEPQRARRAARGGARRASTSSTASRRVEPAIVDGVRAADRVRADARTSTTRPSCRSSSRAAAGRSSTRCSTSRGRRTTARSPPRR